MGIAIFVTVTGWAKISPFTPPRAALTERFWLPLSAKSEGTMISGMLLDSLKFRKTNSVNVTVDCLHRVLHKNPSLWRASSDIRAWLFFTEMSKPNFLPTFRSVHLMPRDRIILRSAPIFKVQGCWSIYPGTANRTMNFSHGVVVSVVVSTVDIKANAYVRAEEDFKHGPGDEGTSNG
jgi:hypothetical protein